ncbi:MAG TPA: phosphotyrosine protein phosphatase [Gallionella sp.]|nr:phosphotyrosine protein phosphatase [Gallionella sp.]
MKASVLFVCMGNICRSPTAEAVFRHYVENAELSASIQIDSAGTHDYHIGHAPDARAQQAAQQRGYDMSNLRGRQVDSLDFERFDYILAMDKANLAILQYLAPRGCKKQVGLFLDYARHYRVREVPDPYYGGAQGFELVLDMVEDAAQGLLQHIRQNIS